MRASWVVAGINKLFPTLRAVSPSSIEQLPRGLAAVAGRRVAVDGTLAVVRLAYAATRAHSRQIEREEEMLLRSLRERSKVQKETFSDPSDPLWAAPDEPHTVLDWYRILFAQLLRSLLAHSIRTFVVLDDPSRRLPEKERELERRQQGRELSIYRAQVEQDRTDRLDRLHARLERATTLAEAQVALQAEMPPPYHSDLAITTSESSNFEGGIETPDLAALPSPPSAAMTMSRTQAAMAQAEKSIVQRLLAREPEQQSPKIEPLAPPSIPSATPVPTPPSAREPIPKATQVTLPEPPSTPPPDMSQEEAFLPATPPAPESLPDAARLAQARDEIRFLQQESDLLHKQYTRRRTPPMRQLIEETLAMCKRYNVPVLRIEESSASIMEAEALASAIVLHGYADMVLSEDSDVVVYGAPLLRLRGTRAELVHSIQAWRELFPSSVQVEEEVDEAWRMAGMGAMDAFPELQHSSPEEEKEQDDRLRAKMVDFAILCGSDFCPTLPGVGPKRALEGLRTHGSIEGLVDASLKTGKPRTSVPLASGSWERFFCQVNAARSIFFQNLDLSPWEDTLRRAQEEKLPVIEEPQLSLDGGQLTGWADAYAELDVEGKTSGLAVWPPPEN